MYKQSFFLSATVFRCTAALALSSTLFACVYDNDPPKHYGGSGDTTATPSPPPDTFDAGTTTPTTPTSVTPMLVTVDTGQVMNADAGQGVGIFTEYAAGGKWHVWWTCDTAKSQLQCDVNLTASAATGTLDALDTSALQGAGTVTPTASSVNVAITTTTEVHGITFTTTPGVALTLQATIGGLTVGPGVNQSFFFFVQNGQINGGYTGPLTNPLQLQGSAP